MRYAIANVMSAAARHLGGKAPACPTEPTKTSSEPFSCIAHFNPSQDATMSSSNEPLFTGSQLCRVEFADGALVDAVDIAFCDGAVQRAAAEALAKLTSLHEVIGLRSEIARGIDAAMGADHDTSKISPAVVVQAIKRRTAEIEDAMAAAKADKLTHNSVNTARRDRLAALNSAVNKAFANLTAERDGLIRQVDSYKHTDTNAEERRLRQLREAGLSMVEINSLGGPRAADREAITQAARKRIVEIDTLLPKCKEFWNDPWRHTAVLVGLGLDDEIAKYEACRVEPYEVLA